MLIRDLNRMNTSINILGAACTSGWAESLLYQRELTLLFAVQSVIVICHPSHVRFGSPALWFSFALVLVHFGSPSLDVSCRPGSPNFCYARPLQTSSETTRGQLITFPTGKRFPPLGNFVTFRSFMLNLKTHRQDGVVFMTAAQSDYCIKSGLHCQDTSQWVGEKKAFNTRKTSTKPWKWNVM